MSKETIEHLNTQTLIGDTDERGPAWHFSAKHQGPVSNHYPGAIPVADVRDRLFNWDPIEMPLIINAGDREIVDPTRKVIVRPDTDTVLGVFKSGYQIHGYNEWLINNVGHILDTNLGELHIGSAGLLQGGGVGWVQFNLNETVGVKDVKLRPFLTAAGSCNGSLSSTYMVGAQLIVCDNTMNIAMSDEAASRVRIKHSRHSLDRIGEVRDELQLVWETAAAFEAEITRLTAQTVDEKKWEQFLDEWTGLNRKDELSKHAVTIGERTRDELDGLWKNDDMVSPWAGTAWGVTAATNTHLHHFAQVRDTGAVTVTKEQLRAERNTSRMVLGGKELGSLHTKTLRALARV